MSLPSCLPGLVADGKLTAEQASEAEALYGEIHDDMARALGPEAAAAQASAATLTAMEAATRRKSFLAARTIQTRQRIMADLAGYGGGAGGGAGGGGPIDPRGGPALFDGDDRATYSNVDGRRRAIRARAHRMIDKILSDHSANLLGQVRNKAQLLDLVRERFGEDSGNLSAREMAAAFDEAAEMLRQRFNAAGGDIGKLDKWGLPQSHDAELVRKAGFDDWFEFIEPKLDRAAMVDQRTGRPFTDQGLKAALKEVFETIRSDGWTKRTPGAAGVGALANRRGDPRFLVFRSADAWNQYAERFGAGTAFDAMMGHIDGMARDIAMLEVLGPNPTATVAWLKDTLEKSARLDQSPDSKAVDAAHKSGKRIDRLWNEITGASLRPENRKLALGFSTLRAVQTAAKLGGAMLSAVTDLGFQGVTRKFNGLPAASMLPQYAKLFLPGSRADQRLAVRRGLIADEWSHRTASQSRYLGEELTGEVSRRLAEGVLRLSGLQRWTQTGRWAFGMELLGTLTEQAGERFDALDPALQRMFKRYGIGAEEWDKIRVSPQEMDGGVPWLTPSNVEDQALGDRLLELIARESDHAVPVPDLSTRALVHSAAPAGTLHGELIKSAFLFKSFGISVMLMHGKRAIAQGPARGAGYAASLAIATTLMGGLALLLKDLAAGRDPREVKSPGFWGQAAAQGGGFGIFGDFLRSSQSRAGGGLASTALGPLWGDAAKLAAIPGAKNPRGAAFKAAKDLLPGGTLWYTRLAFDRMVADQVQELIDPHYRQSWKSMNRWAREQGSGLWWAPGETAPRRAPDLNNITEGQRR